MLKFKPRLSQSPPFQFSGRKNTRDWVGRSFCAKRSDPVNYFSQTHSLNWIAGSLKRDFWIRQFISGGASIQGLLVSALRAWSLQSDTAKAA